MNQASDNSQEPSQNYLDFDDDHVMDQNNDVLERKNSHKVKYLQQENQRLRLELKECHKNIQVNKNMIQVVLDH